VFQEWHHRYAFTKLRVAEIFISFLSLSSTPLRFISHNCRLINPVTGAYYPILVNFTAAFHALVGTTCSRGKTTGNRAFRGHCKCKSLNLTWLVCVYSCWWTKTTQVEPKMLVILPEILQALLYSVACSAWVMLQLIYIFFASFIPDCPFLLEFVVLYVSFLNSIFWFLVFMKLVDHV